MQTPLCELDNRVITKQKVYAYEELFYPKADNEAERKDFATYQADCLHIQGDENQWQTDSLLPQLNCNPLKLSLLKVTSNYNYLRKEMNTIISPSLLAADFLHLSEEVKMINESEAEWLHMDIMDGVFVPNISLGFPVLNAVGKECTKALDVHFMIVHPEQYIRQAADAGAKIMTVHQEACTHLHRTISEIHEAGMKAGVALNPATPISTLEDVINDIDLVLIMSVNPGFGGQKFIENTINKVERMKAMITASGSHALIEVDGGVNGETAPRLIKAGVDVLVSGSYVFKATDPKATIKSLLSYQR